MTANSGVRLQLRRSNKNSQVSAWLSLPSFLAVHAKIDWLPIQEGGAQLVHAFLIDAEIALAHA